MRRLPLIALATLVLLAGDKPPDSEAVKKDMAALEGEWTMVSGERNGQSVPDELRKTFRRVVKGGESTVTWKNNSGEEQSMKATFSIDPTAKPKSIDFTVADGPNKGRKMPGIYEVDGDTTKFCYAEKERPTDFTTAAGSGRTLSTWKRDKK